LGEGAKQLIDTEELVRWAASHELPKARTPTGFVFPPLRLLPDGELVGRWTSPASYPSTSLRFAGKGSGGSIGPVAFAGAWGPSTPQRIVNQSE
jgi:hypothetical protein